MFSEELKDFDFWRFLLVLLDLGLVAFLLYHILFLLSRTRALQLLLGVLLLIFIDVLARYLELTTLSWIIKNISTYLVIGLIVLMQPELRRFSSWSGTQRDFPLALSLAKCAHRTAPHSSP